jgi:cytochrome oxidase Cu insertion factor (SCO1/SenC/PrrC family)
MILVYVIEKKHQRLLSFIFLIVPIIMVLLTQNMPYDYTQNFSIIDIDGNNFELNNFNGKVVLINFMSTWCSYCFASMSDLKDVWEIYKDRIVFLSISTNPLNDTEDVLRSWRAFFNVTWIHARDINNPPISQLYKITDLPTYVIIDKKGVLRRKYVRQISKEILLEELENLLIE